MTMMHDLAAAVPIAADAVVVTNDNRLSHYS